MEEVKNIVPAFLNNKKLLWNYRKNLIFYRWEKIVGADLAQQVIPQELQFKKLYVYFKNPVWATNFQYVKHEIIKRINELVEDEMVVEIVFTRRNNREAPKQWLEFSPEEEFAQFKQRMEDVEIPLDVQVEYQEMVEGMENRELANKICQLMGMHYRRQVIREEDGWEACRNCGMLMDRSNGILCDVCRRELEADQALELREIFQIMPHIKYNTLVESLECDHSLFNRVKDETILAWCSKLRPGIDFPDKRVPTGTETYSQNADKVIMLYNSLTWEELNDTIRKKTMNRLRFSTAYWDLPTEEEINKILAKEELGKIDDK